MSIATASIVDVWLNERITVIGSFIGLQRSLNDGVAFGLHLGAFQNIFIFIALILITVFAVHSAKKPIEQIGFGLIVGGGIANVIDRIRDGYVTDMIQIGSFPIFNIADVCINIGVGLLLFELIIGWLHREKMPKT